MYFIFIKTNRPKNGGNDCGYKVNDTEASRTVDCVEDECMISFVDWFNDAVWYLKPNQTIEEKMAETFPSWNLTLHYYEDEY